jgi:hypothetical protein
MKLKRKNELQSTLAFFRIGISQVCKFASPDLEKKKLKNLGIFQNILESSRSFVYKCRTWSCDTRVTASYDHRKWTRYKINFDMRKK